jgi:hypothetical protein
MNKNAIKVLKVSVKITSDAGRATARQIQSLKFRSADAARQYGVLSKAKGDASVRAERKALRNPESGSERYDLWSQKRRQGNLSRHHMLAIGFLRGRAYLTMERTCAEANKPSAKWVHDTILAAFLLAGEVCPWTKDHVKAWLAGDVASVEAAAE